MWSCPLSGRVRVCEVQDEEWRGWGGGGWFIWFVGGKLSTIVQKERS